MLETMCRQLEYKCTFTIKKRIVTVIGDHGKLERSFRHLPVDTYLENTKLIKVEKWFGTKKELTGVQTILLT